MEENNPVQVDPVIRTVKHLRRIKFYSKKRNDPIAPDVGNTADQFNKFLRELSKINEEKQKLNDLIHQLREEFQIVKDENTVLREQVVKLTEKVADDSNDTTQSEGKSNRNDSLAEAIRVASLTCPTLDSNDRNSIKKFVQKVEEYKLFGGTRRVSTLIRKRIVETIISRFVVAPKEFMELEDKDVLYLLYQQFNAKNGFSWAEEFKKIKLKKSRDYSFGFLRDYIDEFESALKFAGNQFQPPEKAIVKLFINGIEDSTFTAEILRHDPKTLEDVYNIAEETRTVLCDFVATSSALGITSVSQDINKKSETERKPLSESSANVKKWCPHHKTTSHGEDECNYLKRLKSNTSPEQKPSEKAKPQELFNQNRVPFVPSWKHKDEKPKDDKLQTKTIEINSVSTFVASDLFREIGRVSPISDPNMDFGIQLSILFDSGCSADCISDEMFKELSALQKEPIPYTISTSVVTFGLSSSTLSTDLKKVKLAVKLNIKESPLQFITEVFVVKSLTENFIIGLNTLRTYGLLSYIENPEAWLRQYVEPAQEEIEESDFEDLQFQKISLPNAEIDLSQVYTGPDFKSIVALQQIIETFQYQFYPLSSKDYLKVPPMRIELRPDTKLRHHPARRTSSELNEHIKEEVKNLLDIGFIRQSFSEVTSPVVPVMQKDKFRLCNDYRELNLFTVAIHHPIPLIESTLNRLHNRKWKIKLDMIKSFNQILMHKDSIPLTAFVTLDGEYEWLRVPFGLKNSPSYLNYVMNEIIFKGLDQIVICFFDDILIHGETESELLDNFTAIMLRAQEFNVHFNLKKCLFGVTEVVHLGHILNENGIRMSTERISMFQSLPAPNSRKSLQRFLGMANYFNKFVKDYATLSAPLTAMTGPKSTFDWDDNAQKSFDVLKTSISHSASLYFIDYSLPIVLRVDASLIGVGGVLMNYSNHEERIIQFISHKFSPQAQKWSTFEQEGFAIYWSVMKFQHYLFGHYFTLQTDHRNLLWMDKAASPKVVRWRLRLQEFNFTITHIPGKSNVIADYFSRVEINQIDITKEPDDMIKEVHNSIIGHHGIIRTFKLLLEKGYRWPKMKDDIKQFVLSCPLCQKIRDMNHKFSQSFGHLPYYAPGEAIFSDGLGPFPTDNFGNTYLIANISSGDHWLSLHPVPSLDVINTVHALLRDFSNSGCPRIFWSDQGSNYTAKVLKEFCAFFTIEQKFSLPYRPQANSIIERSHRETLRYLRTLLTNVKFRDSWTLIIPMVQWIHNTSYIHALGSTPMRMRFGDSVDINRGFYAAQDGFSCSEELIQMINDQFFDVISVASNHSQRDSAETNNQELENIQVGDYVLASYPNAPPSKLHAPFRGPMLVLERIRNEGFLCQDIITQSQLQISNDRIKKFIPPKDFEENDFISIAASDHNEYEVEAILDHKGNPKKKNTLFFKVKWKGYDISEATWEPWSNVQQLYVLNDYLASHRNLQI
jgi:hypothetical protein